MKSPNYQYQSICLLLLVSICCFSCKKKDKPTAAATDLQLNYIEVEEKGYGAVLYLHGNFGAEGTGNSVKVGRAEVNKIVEWTPNFIKCEIGSSEALNASGEVVVSANGKKSNSRILNQWDGKLTFIRPSGGTLEDRVVFDIHLRADIKEHPALSFRLNPKSSFTFNSTATWSVGGHGTSVYNDGGCNNSMTVDWTAASGSFLKQEAGFDRSLQNENFQAEVKFTDQGFQVDNFKFHKFKATQHLRSGISCGRNWSNAPEDKGIHNFPSNFAKFVLSFKPNSSTINSGSLVLTNQENAAGLIYDASDVNRFHTVKLEWDEMRAKY